MHSCKLAFNPPVEQPRQEFFVRGTEMQLASLPQAETLPPRIVGPGNGAILAIDPDIPPGRQKVRFHDTSAPAAAIWVVNGEPQPATAVDTLEWLPVPGSHHIRLLYGSGRLLDETVLTVRGRAWAQTSAKLNASQPE